MKILTLILSLIILCGCSVRQIDLGDLGKTECNYAEIDSVEYIAYNLNYDYSTLIKPAFNDKDIINGKKFKIKKSNEKENNSYYIKNIITIELNDKMYTIDKGYKGIYGRMYSEDCRLYTHQNTNPRYTEKINMLIKRADNKDLTDEDYKSLMYPYEFKELTKFAEDNSDEFKGEIKFNSTQYDEVSLSYYKQTKPIIKENLIVFIVVEKEILKNTVEVMNVNNLYFNPLYVIDETGNEYPIYINKSFVSCINEITCNLIQVAMFSIDKKIIEQKKDFKFKVYGENGQQVYKIKKFQMEQIINSISK